MATDVEALHQERPGSGDTDDTYNPKYDRLDQQVEPQQAGHSGTKCPNRDENGEEGNGQDLDDRKGDRDDHPEPEARHRRKF
jgi:hypothetical protein